MLSLSYEICTADGMMERCRKRCLRTVVRTHISQEVRSLQVVSECWTIK